MKIKSESGYSLIEIGIALVVVAIFMISSITLLSASNDNYRRIEQRNIAMTYAMKTIEAMQLDDVGISIDEIKNKASKENNMVITTNIENLPPKDGKNYGSKVQIITANVKYYLKNPNNADEKNAKTLTLQTLKVIE